MSDESQQKKKKRHIMSFLYCKDQRFEQRKCITDVEFNGNVENLKAKVFLALGVPVERQEIVYHGTVLRDEQTLASYDVMQGETVHVLSKHLPKEKDPKDDIDMKKLVSLMESATQNPLYKLSVYKMLMDSDALDQLVNATPGLRQDIVAMGLLRNPGLMIALAATPNLETVLQEHPCLAHATSQIVASITENTTMSASQMLHGRARHEADAINDELLQMDPRLVAQAELLAAREEALRMNRAAQQGSAGPSSSSPATAGGSGRASDPTPSNTSTASAGPRQLITPGLFSQAIAAAMSNAQQSPTPSPPLPPAANAQFEVAMQQIRMMGIQASREAILQALTVADGNVEVAVNLLFEGNL